MPDKDKTKAPAPAETENGGQAPAWRPPPRQKGKPRAEKAAAPTGEAAAETKKSAKPKTKADEESVAPKTGEKSPEKTGKTNAEKIENKSPENRTKNAEKTKAGSKAKPAKEATTAPAAVKRSRTAKPQDVAFDSNSGKQDAVKAKEETKEGSSPKGAGKQAGAARETETKKTKQTSKATRAEEPKTKEAPDKTARGQGSAENKEDKEDIEKENIEKEETKVPAPAQEEEKEQALQKRAKHKREAWQPYAVMALFTAGLLLASLLLVAALRLRTQNLRAVQGVPQLAMVEDTAEGEEGLSTLEIVAKALPSVVSIDLYNNGELTPHGSGSGIILSQNGYVATCAHVVRDGGNIRVVLANGKGYTAAVVGADSRTDLAVLKINAKNLTPAEFAHSDNVLVGQKAVAIGNVLGTLPGTPSVGIVSGTGRMMALPNAAGESIRMGLLQTDAAINQGSSGGALVDGFGRVIGITVGKIEEEAADNIGFAIPSAVVVPVLQRLMEEGEAHAAALLGVSVVALNETTAPPVELPQQGLYIVQVTKESSLRAAGVQEGDVIMQVGDVAVREEADLYGEIYKRAPGDELELEIYKGSTGGTETVTAVLYAAQG